MALDETRRITDLGTLKALAHPLRLRLYRALSHAGTATASHLADQVDEAVSLVSYHLRRLAAHGLILEAEPQSADGRERWWQVDRGLQIQDSDFRDAPERAAAYASFTRLAFREHSEVYERYLDEQPTWDQEWRAAAFSSQFLPRLTAGELATMHDELTEVLKRWESRAMAAVEAGDTDGRENVVLHLYGFPTRP
ncbi:ArsR/SmtB family transcription factor [Nonomuraea sp. SBT364]|uniref:ArsR/SmtB family transcription factor n=1 Tax=Nonomuraea sp. SBT364 TaxID=1580530 RepID=UPI00066E6F4E|nr:helix-turn-helix domain-containing protein [Nonomuraea sp. SBT364]